MTGLSTAHHFKDPKPTAYCNMAATLLGTNDISRELTSLLSESSVMYYSLCKGMGTTLLYLHSPVPHIELC